MKKLPRILIEILLISGVFCAVTVPILYGINENLAEETRLFLNESSNSFVSLLREESAITTSVNEEFGEFYERGIQNTDIADASYGTVQESPVDVSSRNAYDELVSRLLKETQASNETFRIFVRDLNRNQLLDKPDQKQANLVNEPFERTEELSADDLILQNDWFGKSMINGIPYYVYVQEPEEQSNTFIISALSEESAARSGSVSHWVVFLCSLVVFVFAVSIRLYTFYRGDIKCAAPLVIGGTVILLLTTCFSSFLSSSIAPVSRNEERLEELKEIDNFSNELYSDLMKRTTNTLADELHVLGRRLRDDSGIMSPENLKELSSKLHYKYLMVFNRNGNLIATDSPYSSVTLSEIASDNAMLPLIKGVEPLMAEPQLGNLSSYIGEDTKNLILFGVTLRNESDSADGALVACLQTEMQSEEHDLKNYAYNIAGSNALVLIIDRESLRIEYSSIPGLPSNNASECGFTNTMLTDSFNGPIRLNGKSYAASSALFGDKLVFFAHAPQIDLLAAFLSALVLSIPLWICLLQFLVFSRRKTAASEDAEESEENIARESTSIQLNLYKRILSKVHRRHSKMESVKKDTAAELPRISSFDLIALFYLAEFLVMFIFTLSWPNYLRWMNNWTKSFNAISLSHCVLTVTIILAIAFVIHMFLRLLSRTLDQQGITVCQLLRSCTSYISAIIAVLVTLDTFGVDTNKILAAMGLMGLVVGLGAQKLIGDLIAGLFIIFERTVSVGDIVRIGDAYGVVKLIGMRTMQIVTKSNDIITINNSSINAMCNLSRFVSSAYIKIQFPSDLSIEYLETVFKGGMQLAQDEKRVPTALWGPICMGMRSVSEKGITFAFLATCDERYVSRTERAMYREVKLLCEEHHIPFTVLYYNDDIRRKQNHNLIDDVDDIW